MKLRYSLLIITGLSLSNALLAQAPLVFKGKKVTLTVNTAGSAISSFILNDTKVNPLNWKLQPTDMPENNRAGPPFQGHFLCVGRWGSPSAEEKKRGIPHNGEVNTLTWQTKKDVSLELSTYKAVALCIMPKERMTVTREIEVPSAGQVFFVREKFTNDADLGRIWNVVQHATIGSPFLDEKTLIDCNSTVGFDQRTRYDSLEKKSFDFKNAVLPDGPADLRKTNDDRGWCTSHLVDKNATYGWVTASSLSTGTLIGYIWKKDEYPWLNLWHQKGGKDRMWAHGIEFGTAGLGQPYKLLVENNVSFFGKNMYDWIEAGETVTKSYVGFIMKIPKDFKGVGMVSLDKDKITITELGGKLRKIKIDSYGFLN